MKQLALTILLLSIACYVAAQTKPIGSMKGTVVDAFNKLPLPDATITVLAKADSAVIGYAVANKQGGFEIKNMPAGQFIVGFSFTGYQELIRHLDITPSKPDLNLDTIALATDTTMLASVIVTVPPITIKKDTVEFRASAFKTKPNAVVEDLLKKLPGVEVDKDGNVTSQGENITKIYVDGKEFFGNDPKLATKNLTADLVESIQVFDDMSDQAKFTRIDDGSRQRTINIKLKKDRRKGIFGRVTAGAGSSERYDGRLFLNMFNNDQRLSILGGANNINRLGYTNTDVISNMGGMGGFSGGGRGGRRGGGGGIGNSNTGNGNTNTWNAGVNYRDDWGPKMDFTGNYFVSHNNNVNRSTSYRQNFFPEDSVTHTDEGAYRKNASLNHRFGFRWEYQIDSMNSILLTPNINVQHSESESYDSAITRASSAKFNYTAITNKSNRTSERDGVSFNNNLLFRHRFKKQGRTFTIGWNTAVNDSEGDGYNQTPYIFYNPDGTINRTQNQDRRNLQLTNSFNNTISTSLTEMIDSNKIVELNYAYTFNKNTSDRDTYEYRPGTNAYDSINKSLTNYFENLFVSSRIGLNFRLKKVKYDFQVGGAVQYASLENMSHRALFGKDSMMKQRYTNFFPNASFNYNLGTRKSLRFNYRGSTRAPSISQLQDFRDESNPLNIRTGNPNLEQEFDNQLNFSYNTFNMTNFLFLNINITGSMTSNKIVNSIDSIGKAVQLTRPENVNGAHNISFSGTIGIPLIKVTTGRRSPMNLNLTSTVRYGRDVSKLYKEINYSYTKTLGQRIRFDYNIPDKLDIGTNASYNYNDASYSVQEDLNNKYFNQSYSLDVTYTFFKNFMLSSDFDYYVNSGRSDGFNQNIPLWNASVAWVLFKKRNGELRFSVVDLLNQNKNIDRTIGDNYIEDSYTETLQRFFMVSFMYNLNRFGGRRQGQSQGQGEFRRNTGGDGGGRSRF